MLFGGDGGTPILAGARFSPNPTVLDKKIKGPRWRGDP